jgi:hypothetical protein
MKVTFQNALIVVAASFLVLAGACWYVGPHKVSPHIVLVFPTSHHRLWILGETQTELVRAGNGNIAIKVNPIRKELEVRGLGTIQYKTHNIIVSAGDVLVDGKSLETSSNWVLQPNGKLDKGFVPTFE